VLTLFSTTLHGVILQALAAGPLSLSDLSSKVGEPTTKALRGNIGNLIGIGALEKRRAGGEQNLVDNELTDFGRELLFVGEVLEAWLRSGPDGALGIESVPAKEAIRALVGGWNSTMLRALAVRSLSPPELDELISSFGQSALERRLFAMRSAGLAAAESSRGSTVYAPTDWLREGAAPLLAAIRCEHLFLAAEVAPLGRLDVETLLLLALPLVGSLGAAHDGVSGTCQLAVDTGGEHGPAGIRVVVDGGAIASYTAKLEPGVPEWTGSSGEWLDSIVGGTPWGAGEQAPGDLPAALLEALHRSFFPDRNGETPR
jgi:DNA-binding HxlR family transcriptional regulator